MRRTRTKRGWYKPAGERMNRLLDVFQDKLQQLGNQFLQEAEDWLAGEKLQLSCKRGCNYCCRCAFVCSLPEGMLIARYLLVFHADLLPELTPRLFVQESMQEELGADGWWQEQEDCALLRDVDCLVYPVRPANCRAHLAITDPELCRAGKAKILDPDKAMQARDKLATAFVKALTGQERMVAAVLPCAIGRGLNSMMTGKVSLGAPLSDDALEQFRKKWSPKGRE
jgi:Fe-S-cluster containining protein